MYPPESVRCGVAVGAVQPGSEPCAGTVALTVELISLLPSLVALHLLLRWRRVYPLCLVPPHPACALANLRAKVQPGWLRVRVCHAHHA